MSSNFPVTNGVCQGDVYSPLLLNDNDNDNDLFYFDINKQK